MGVRLVVAGRTVQRDSATLARFRTFLRTRFASNMPLFPPAAFLTKHLRNPSLGFNGLVNESTFSSVSAFYSTLLVFFLSDRSPSVSGPAREPSRHTEFWAFFFHPSFTRLRKLIALFPPWEVSGLLPQKTSSKLSRNPARGFLQEEEKVFRSLFHLLEY